MAVSITAGLLYEKIIQRVIGGMGKFLKALTRVKAILRNKKKKNQ